jgi:hypothetical protein
MAKSYTSLDEDIFKLIGDPTDEAFVEIRHFLPSAYTEGDLNKYNKVVSQERCGVAIYRELERVKAGK